MTAKRAINFRAWDKVKKVMMFVHDIRLTRYGQVMDVFASETNIVDDALWFNHLGVELMQYTGLLDRNGKEIYEGDILIVRELHDGDEDCWNNSKQQGIPQKVYWNNEYLRFDFGGCSRAASNPKHFEVIGNVWEQPHLLKEDK